LHLEEFNLSLIMIAGKRTITIFHFIFPCCRVVPFPDFNSLFAKLFIIQGSFIKIDSQYHKLVGLVF